MQQDQDTQKRDQQNKPTIKEDNSVYPDIPGVYVVVSEGPKALDRSKRS